jgi:hypothetical protein
MTPLPTKASGWGDRRQVGNSGAASAAARTGGAGSEGGPRGTRCRRQGRAGQSQRRSYHWTTDDVALATTSCTLHLPRDRSQDRMILMEQGHYGSD